jgi:hypothetical protein
MNILYFSAHEVLEYDDLRLLTDLGHSVFAMGIFGLPQSNSTFREPRPEFFSPQHYTAFNCREHILESGIPKLHRAFVDGFDTIIVNHEPRVLEVNREAFAGKPVVWRTVQARRATERMAWKAGRNLFVVRHSKRESEPRYFIPANAVIYFGKYEDDYGPWNGLDGSVLTFFNDIARGDAIPSVSDYLAIVAGFNALLFGRQNKDISNWQGLASASQQVELLRRCRVYLYVHSELACYTLNFIEALMSGAPILAPSAKFVGSKKHDPNWRPWRYEVEELLSGGAGLIYDSVDEARELLQAVLGGRARERAIELFSAKIVRGNWAEALTRSTAEAPFSARRHRTILGLYQKGINFGVDRYSFGRRRV